MSARQARAAKARKVLVPLGGTSGSMVIVHGSGRVIYVRAERVDDSTAPTVTGYVDQEKLKPMAVAAARRALEGA